jgi:hypothetical protein
MWRTIWQSIFLVAGSALSLSLSAGVAEASGVKTYKGKFADGATYLMQVPSSWMEPWSCIATDM